MTNRGKMLFLAVVTFLAHGWTAPLAVAAAAPTTSFNFRTPFVPTMGYAEFYTAQALHWPKLNLDGKALPGKGSAATVQTVAAGSEQMGYSAISSVIAGIQQGMPIKIIAIGQRRDPSGLVFLKGSGIRELKDVIGKRVGNFPFGSTGPLFRIALRRIGVPEREVQIVNVTPGGEVALLLEKKIDAFGGFSGAQDVWMRCQGHDTDSIAFATVGLEIYGQAIFVNNKWAEQVGDDVVGRALLGIIQGSVTVKQEPEEAIKILQRLNPQAPIERYREWSSLPAYIRWSWHPESPVVRKQGWGWTDPGEMERTQKILLEAGVLQKEMDISGYYTNRFLQQPQVRQAAMEWNRSPWADVPDDVKKKCGL